MRRRLASSFIRRSCAKTGVGLLENKLSQSAPGLWKDVNAHSVLSGNRALYEESFLSPDRVWGADDLDSWFGLGNAGFKNCLTLPPKAPTALGLQSDYSNFPHVEKFPTLNSIRAKVSIPEEFRSFRLDEAVRESKRQLTKSRLRLSNLVMHWEDALHERSKRSAQALLQAIEDVARSGRYCKLHQETPPNGHFTGDNKALCPPEASPEASQVSSSLENKEKACRLRSPSELGSFRQRRIWSRLEAEALSKLSYHMSPSQVIFLLYAFLQGHMTSKAILSQLTFLLVYGHDASETKAGGTPTEQFCNPTKNQILSITDFTTTEVALLLTALIAHGHWEFQLFYRLIREAEKRMDSLSFEDANCFATSALHLIHQATRCAHTDDVFPHHHHSILDTRHWDPYFLATSNEASIGFQDFLASNSASEVVEAAMPSKNTCKDSLNQTAVWLLRYPPFAASFFNLTTSIVRKVTATVHNNNGAYVAPKGLTRFNTDVIPSAAVAASLGRKLQEAFRPLLEGFVFSTTSDSLLEAYSFGALETVGSSTFKNSATLRLLPSSSMDDLARHLTALMSALYIWLDHWIVALNGTAFIRALQAVARLTASTSSGLHDSNPGNTVPSPLVNAVLELRSNPPPPSLDGLLYQLVAHLSTICYDMTATELQKAEVLLDDLFLTVKRDTPTIMHWRRWPTAQPYLFHLYERGDFLSSRHSLTLLSTQAVTEHVQEETCSTALFR